MEQHMIFSRQRGQQLHQELCWTACPSFAGHLRPGRAVQLQDLPLRPPLLHPQGRRGRAAVRACSRDSALRLRFRPENGMKVIASGRISVFPRDGAYQLYCRRADRRRAWATCTSPSSSSRRSCEREGLFDPAHKKPLPHYPKTHRHHYLRAPARRCTICSAFSARASR